MLDLVEATLPNHTILCTRHPEEASILITAQCEAGNRQFVAVGGDGTLHVLLNALCNQQHIPSQAFTIGVIPIGTGNDWIKTHKLPQTPKEAIQMLLTKKTTLQDIGLVRYMNEGKSHQRYFLNIAGMAYDAYVVRHAERVKKYIPQKITYLLMSVLCLFTYKHVTARILSPAFFRKGVFYTINVGVCRFSGGGMQLTPHADPFSGKLAVTLAEKISVLEVLKAIPLFYQGKLGSHPKVSLHAFEQIDILSDRIDEEIWLEADGELLGTAPALFECIPRGINIILPA